MKKKKIDYNFIIYIFTLLITIIFAGIIIKSNMIPFKYLIILLLILVILNVIIGLLLFKFKKKIIGYILSFILLLITILGTYYLNSTLGFIKGFGKDNYKEENFLVLVLKDSPYQELNDLENKKIGYILNELTGIDKAIEQLDSILTYEKVLGEDYDKLLESLYNNKTDAVVIEENQKNLIYEQNDKSDDIKVLYTINIKTKLEKENIDLNVTNQPFAVYLTGIDTYGSIKAVSRSDVNIVAVVNPNSKQVLLISVPRDYYVQISGTSGLKDKLTHAGIYGIDTSVKTLEDLLELDISYYFKVNFSSVIKIVDRLDGIDVYSKYSFSSSTASGGTFRFTKGYNHLNGIQTLAFVRERKAIGLTGGDRSRGENQQAVISGLINKATSSAIITKYTKILNDLNGTFQTNMEEEDITSLVKMQLNDMAKWNVTSISLNGYDAYDYTYSYPSQKLYVMKPNEETVNNAIDLINKVLNGELLESSYEEATDIKNPTEYTPVVTPKPSVPSQIEIKKPTISLIGDSKVILLTNQTYEEKGVSISVDLTDTVTNLDSVVKTGSVDTTIPGEYTITYSITDTYKNSASITRVVYVLDPLLDYDVDGFTNQEEIDANTDPLDATSYPIIDPIEPILPIEPEEPIIPEEPVVPSEPIEDPSIPEEPIEDIINSDPVIDTTESNL